MAIKSSIEMGEFTERELSGSPADDFEPAAEFERYMDRTRLVDISQSLFIFIKFDNKISIQTNIDRRN